MTITIERWFILILQVISLIFAIAIWSRSDKEERWLMPLCVLSSAHTILVYVIFIFFRHNFESSLLNYWSTLLRVQTSLTHAMMTFFIVSRGSKLWKH